MSVKKVENKGGNTAALEKKIGEVEAAGGKSAALLALSFKAQIVADRAAGAGAITDETILQSAELIEYNEWQDGKAYQTIGEIVKHDGLYFEIVAAHTSNGAAYPVKTTFAYYRLIEIAATGVPGNPIPYPEDARIVVNVASGRYYGYKGAVYLAKADMPHCVYPPDTPGLWQWEKVKA
jgi:hypothetical protein